MQSRWTLVVEGLGKIERAEVRTHPLMLFVGANNSGKSYLASVLWGLLNLPAEFFQLEDLETEIGRPCVTLTDRLLDCGRRGIDFTLAAEELSQLLALFNDTLRRRPQSLTEYVFNASSVSLQKLAIESFVPGSTWTVRGAAREIPASFGPAERAALLGRMVRVLLIPSIGLKFQLDPSYVSGDPVYLPASRTGFMLLYKAVIGSQIRRLFKHASSSIDALDLPSPIIHFLTLLSSLKPELGPFAAEADFIERHALDGALVMRPLGPTNEFEYQVGPERTPLTLGLSSSLVSELAPLILVLRHVKQLPALILEEPEAHQHPAVQRIIAQVLVRLVRRGVAIWVTTHSENFCQQINNFIKLGEHPERARWQRKFGYEAEEYLLKDEVGGYQFQLSESGHSVVTELAKSEQGLTMPTFNDPLRKLAEETLALERRTSDEDAE
jgi:energy-coupling factor transporter ATP-binding protein EcfA2